MRIGHVESKYHVLHEAKQNLLRQLGRSIEPSFDSADLVDAIEQLIDAKIASAMDRRY